MRSAYLETLYELAGKDKNVYAIISDNGAIVYDKYRQDFPDQFINAGISEANMVAMAAGMAERGKIPFAYTIGAFLAYRAYEFILNDVCMMNKNVKMVGIGEGCSYSLLGASHHTIFDLAVLRPLPNLTILSPASPMEVKKSVQAAYKINGPVYIRIGTNREPEIYDTDYDFAVGKGIKLRQGTDIALITTGSIAYDVLKAADELEKQGISACVINIHTIKPFDEDIVIRSCVETGNVCVVEEHSVIGGLGSAVAEVVARNNIYVKFTGIGLYDFVHGYGKHDELKKDNGLGIDAIVDACKMVVRG
ncbi:transketolase family protein [Butyrivibrio sp. NC2002]|uniref:transketolase family protein n=1 Tax=Butyrivibrio sp. NC2002 TaxID=1410610 RepID=UPI00055D1ECB|nr:transketolase C-terminal domain-containing protein [Butyrivibrio sp. NC2002]